MVAGGGTAGVVGAVEGAEVVGPDGAGAGVAVLGGVVVDVAGVVVVLGRWVVVGVVVVRVDRPGKIVVRFDDEPTDDPPSSSSEPVSSTAPTAKATSPPVRAIHTRRRDRVVAGDDGPAKTGCAPAASPATPAATGS